MSKDDLQMKLDFDIATKGEEKLDKLDKTVARITANLEKMVATSKAAGAGLTSLVSGQGKRSKTGTGSTANTRNATRALRDQLGIDRDRLQVVKMAIRYRKDEASQAAKAAQSQERQARQSYRDKLTFATRMAAQRVRSDNAALRAVQTEQRAHERAFRQRMGFATRMATQRSREESAAEREIQRGIRETGRLRQAEQRRALADHRSMQRERSRGLSQVRSGGGRVRDGARTVTGVGAAAGAGTVYAGQRAVRAFTSDAVDLDDAMNRNARMQPELGGPKYTGPLMQALREKFRPIAQSLGKTTAEMLNARAEVLQAGVESGIADEVTRVVTQFAVANELNASQVAESFGYGLNALSAGGAVTAERASKLMNVMQYLAANTPASRQQLASFTKRGLGAGAALRMSDQDTLAFGASATSAGADGETAARMLSSDNMKLANHVVEARDIQRKSHKSESDRKFLALPSKLGFRDWDDLAGSMDTDAAGTIQKIYFGVRKAGTATEKLQILKSLFGENFGVFHATMAESGSFEKMRDAARNPEAARALEAAMEEVRTTIGFALIQLKNVFTELSATLGMTLKPLWSDLRDWVLKLSTGFSNLTRAFDKGVKGLLYGLGSKDGTLGSLLTEAFGNPAQMRLNIDAIFAFAHGFGEGIRSVITTVKSVFSTIGTILGASSPAEIGKLIAQFMGFATVLTLMAPAAIVIGALSRGLLGLIEVIVGGARLVAGVGAGAGVAGALGGGGGAAAAAGGAGAAAASKLSGGLGALGLLGLAYSAKQLSSVGASIVDGVTGTDPNKALSASGAQRFGFKSGGIVGYGADYLTGGTGGVWGALSQLWGGDNGRNLAGARIGQHLEDTKKAELAATEQTNKLLTEANAKTQELIDLNKRKEIGNKAKQIADAEKRRADAMLTGIWNPAMTGSVGGGSSAADDLRARGFNVTTPNTTPNGAGNMPTAQGGGVTNPRLSGDVAARAKEAHDFFRSKGYSEEATAGILASLKKESNFTPNARGDGGGAHGIAQWHADRRRQILAGTGIDVSRASFSDQLKAIDWEMNHGDAGAQRARRQLMTPGISAREAGGAFVKHFERPLRDERAERGALAEGFYRQYNGGGSSSGGGAPLAGLGGTSKAVDNARALLGVGSQQAAHALGRKMTPGNWCADFVNGALESANIKGIQGSIATSFRKWGVPVTDGIKAGDVVVTHRGHAAGETGGHVGLATGQTRHKNGRLQYQTISGNYSKRVGSGWEYQDRVEVRRAVEDAQALQRRAAEINKPTTAGRGPADQGPVSAPMRDQWGNSLGQSTPTRTGSGGLGQSTPTRNGPGGRNGDAGSGGSGFNIHGPIHINVPGAGDPKAVASAVNQEMRSRVMARAHDIDPTAV